MSIFTIFLPLVFFAAQGLAVLATAVIAANLLGITRPLGKISALSISYVGWIACTLIGYCLLGGEGGLMDGFGFMLMLCFTALLSSTFWAAVWIVATLEGGVQND